MLRILRRFFKGIKPDPAQRMGKLSFYFNMSLLFLASFVITIAQYTVWLILGPISRSLNRKVQTSLQRIWVDTSACLIVPTKLIMSGDEPTPEEPAILICNHQVDADWCVLICSCLEKPKLPVQLVNGLYR